jgi:RNA-binding proteins (RRM domain)
MTDTSFGAVKEQFAKFGTVEKLFMPKFRETGKFKGIAFVTMSSEAERDAAIAAMNGAEIDGRTVVADKARPRGERNRSSRRGAGDNPDLTKLYIGNISYDTDAGQLEEYFSQYGEVSNVYVPTDRYSGEPRGFAFLAMKPEDAQRAIEESDGMEMNGRTVEVKLSLPRGTKAPNRRSKWAFWFSVWMMRAHLCEHDRL